MPNYPEPQNSWNSIVRATVKRLAMHVVSPSPPDLVYRVEKDKEYNLWLSFKNTSNMQLEYENIEIRLTGRPDQVDFPDGAIDYEGNPRIHLKKDYLGPGQYRGWWIRFRARKSVATKSLKFHTGVYAVLLPQGHYWETFSPTI